MATQLVLGCLSETVRNRSVAAVSPQSPPPERRCGSGSQHGGLKELKTYQNGQESSIAEHEYVGRICAPEANRRSLHREALLLRAATTAKVAPI